MCQTIFLCKVLILFLSILSGVSSHNLFDVHLTSSPVTEALTKYHLYANVASIEFHLEATANVNTILLNNDTSMIQIPLTEFVYDQLELTGSANITLVNQDWTNFKVHLQHVGNDFLLNIIIDRIAPSVDTKLNQIINASAYFMHKHGITANYQMFLEQDVQNPKPCPWINLKHKLVTVPSNLLDFESIVDHQCNSNIDEDWMNILIKVKSDFWPLANINLVQHFKFGNNGEEWMNTISPLFKLMIKGFWSNVQYYKELQFNGDGVVLPSKVHMTFNRFQSNDSYNVDIRIEDSDFKHTIVIDTKLICSSLIVIFTILVLLISKAFY